MSLALLVLVCLPLPTAAQQRRQKPVSRPPASPTPRTEASESRANLIAKTKAYRESLELVQKLQKREEERLTGLVAMRRDLLDAGIIAKRELDETQTQLDAATQQLKETSRQIGEADELVSEVLAAEQTPSIRPEATGTLRTGVTLIRYTGTAAFSLDGFGTIDAFFRERFGRSMPISAFGQSGTHDRMGFDHRGALDVAIHPDTAEGQTLMAYLRSQGIPFIAFRSAVADLPPERTFTLARLRIGLN
jgi:hypothetical protein